MDFIYTPEGATPKRWEWAPGKMPSPEAEEIEKRTGQLHSAAAQACAAGSIRATHAFLFVLLRRGNPALEYDQVVFTADEISWEFTDTDRHRWLANLEAAIDRGEELSETDSAFRTHLRGELGLDKATEATEGPPDPTQPPGKPGKKAAAKKGSKASPGAT